jgi:UDP-N-acetylmuramyl pentapeptide phosphotransferase/UDP-N-acetylglucosamine-1-phosphate transferase
MLPIFLVGISEDAGWRVAPRWRLLAAACSSLLTIFVYGSVIDRLGVFQLDFVFEQQAIAVPLTVLALTGVSHSFNLLDGLHGLCGFTAAIIAVALALISIQAGQIDLVGGSALLVAALVGFLALNFPRGLVFLGDAGATSIGFILACTSVHILYVQPDVAPWALVLVFFWPIADTLLSIARRLKRRSKATQPDRMHFHHVVMRAFEILVLRKKNRAVSNPAATMILLPLIAAPSVAGVLLWNRDDFALTAVAVFAALFLATYGAIVRRARQRRRLFMAAGPKASRTLDLHKKAE